MSLNPNVHTLNKHALNGRHARNERYAAYDAAAFTLARRMADTLELPLLTVRLAQQASTPEGRRTWAAMVQEFSVVQSFQVAGLTAPGDLSLPGELSRPPLGEGCPLGETLPDETLPDAGPSEEGDPFRGVMYALGFTVAILALGLLLNVVGKCEGWW